MNQIEKPRSLTHLRFVIIAKQKGNFNDQITILKRKFPIDDIPILSEDGGGIWETPNKVIADKLIGMDICETLEQHKIRLKIKKDAEIALEAEIKAKKEARANIKAEKEAKKKVKDDIEVKKAQALVIKAEIIKAERDNIPHNDLFHYTESGGIVFHRTDIARYFIQHNNALISPKYRYMYIYNDIEGIYNIDYKGDAVRKELNDMFGDMIDIREQNEIINKVFFHPGLQHDELEEFWLDPRYICCNNGVYNIETKELLPHSPEYYFLSKLPVNYVEDATCPGIDKLMINIFDDTQISNEYEWLGYCLTPGNRYKLISVYIGETDSGRSTYFNIITEMVGNKNIIPIEPQDLTKEFYLINLHGKMICTCADVGTHKITKFNKIKLVVGKDPLLGNDKGKPMVSFVNSAKLMWAANRMPPTDDTTTASYNRFRKVDCIKVIPDDEQKDFVFNDYVTDEELSGLLNHAIEGLHRLEERRCFILPSLIDRMNDIEIATNSIFMWAEDCAQFTREFDDKIFGNDLFTSYSDWCLKNGVKIPVDKDQFIIDFKKSFHKSYINYGMISIRGEAKRGCRGVTWNVDYGIILIDDIEDEYTDDPFDIDIEDGFDD